MRIFYSNNRISDNNTYNKGGMGRCEMNCAEEVNIMEENIMEKEQAIL